MLTFLLPLPTIEIEMFLNIPSESEDDLVFSPGFVEISTFGFSFSSFFKFSFEAGSLLTLEFVCGSGLSSSWVSSSVIVSFNFSPPVFLTGTGISLEVCCVFSSFEDVFDAGIAIGGMDGRDAPIFSRTVS